MGSVLAAVLVMADSAHNMLSGALYWVAEAPWHMAASCSGQLWPCVRMIEWTGGGSNRVIFSTTHEPCCLDHPNSSLLSGDTLGKGIVLWKLQCPLEVPRTGINFDSGTS